MGLTKENAEQLWKDLYEQQYRGADILEGGSLVQQASYIKNMVDPEANIYTSEGMVKGAKNISDTYGYGVNMGTGYGSTMDGAIQSNVNKAWGISGSMAMQMYGKDYEGLSEKFYNNSIDAMSKVEEYGEKETDKFAKGEYLTEEQQQTIYLENLATDLATLKESLGKWWDIGKVLLEGIGSAVAGKLAGNIIGKGIGKLAGSAVGGSGGGILAAGGGIAIGATAAAALIAAINAGVQMANKGSEQHGEEVGKNSVKGTKYENNKAVESLMASSTTISDRGGLQNNWNNMTSGIGYAFSNVFQGTSDRNKNLTQWIMSSDTLGKDQLSIAQKIAVWGLMMDQAGYFDSFKQGMKEAGSNDWGNATAEELSQLLIDNAWTVNKLKIMVTRLLKQAINLFLQINLVWNLSN